MQQPHACSISRISAGGARRHPIEDRLFPHDESCLRPVPIWIAMLLCAAGSISIACLPFLVRSLPCRFGLYNREQT